MSHCKDSKMYEFMLGQGRASSRLCEGNANLLGDQPIVAAPAYIGIVVFFWEL
jgi:hypothetical protein